MIGVALVTFVSIFAAGAKKTINDAVDTGSSAERHRAEHQRLRAVLARGGDAAVGGVPGVQDVSPMRFSPGASVAGKDAGHRRSTRRRFAELYKRRRRASDALTALRRRRTTVVAKGYADDNDIKVGRRAARPDARRRGTRSAARDRASLEDNAGAARPTSRSPTRPSCQRLRVDQGRLRLRRLAPGADPTAVKHAVDALLEPALPEAEALTESGVQGRPGRARSTSCSGSSTRCSRWR